MVVHNFEFTGGRYSATPFHLQLQCVPEHNRYAITVTTMKPGSVQLEIDEKFKYIKTNTGVMYPDTFPPSPIHDMICIILALPMYEFINRNRISGIVSNVIDHHI